MSGPLKNPTDTPQVQALKAKLVAQQADEETIKRLATLPPLEYERQREEEAKRMGCRASVIDMLVKAKRPAKDSELQGSAALCPDVEPWPSPVDGAAVLNETAEGIKRYVSLPDGAAGALALWCAHTHAIDCFAKTPRLNITSPEMNCGKSTLRDVLTLLVRRPLPLENMTTATAFRLVEKFTPTILADEIDRWLKENEELIGFLNSGNKIGGFYVRCEGDNNEPRMYRAFAPVVLCGIGSLKGPLSTLHDRSIVVQLARAKPGEVVARFDERHIDQEKGLCRKLARFCADNRQRIAAIDPKLPNGVFNRLADNWRPLFAIAEVVGGDWPKRCAESLSKLTIRDMETESYRMMVLADIKPMIEEAIENGNEWLATGDIIDTLLLNPERPWNEANRGKPINERWLSVKLGEFGIRPGKLPRDGGGQRRGYRVASFLEAFDRYLSDPPVTSGQVSQQPFSPSVEGETDSETSIKSQVPQQFSQVKTPCETDVHLNPGGEQKKAKAKLDAMSDAEYEGWFNKTKILFPGDWLHFKNTADFTAFWGDK